MISSRNYQLAAEVDRLRKAVKGSSESERASLSAELKLKKKELRRAETKALLAEMNRHKFIYAMLFIPVVYYFIFKYIPIWNAQIAFRDFISLRRTGITGGAGYYQVRLSAYMSGANFVKSTACVLLGLLYLVHAGVDSLQVVIHLQAGIHGLQR